MYKGINTLRVKYRVLFVGRLKTIKNAIDFLICLSFSTTYLGSQPQIPLYLLFSYIGPFLRIY